jgi:hypothetical protein
VENWSLWVNVVHRKKESTVVALTGGLGNQLFQLAAGLSHSIQHRLILKLDTKIGAPRKSRNGTPELFELNDFNILFRVDDAKKSFILRKCFNYLLSSGSQARTAGSRLIFRVIKVASEIIISLYSKQKVNLFVSNQLGYVDSLSKKEAFLIGYFQTYKYFEIPSVKKVFLDMHDSGDESLNPFRQRAIEELPLVVHVRRGDYKNEPKFGLLSKYYYEEAIDQQFHNFGYGKIWLFSDEPESAHNLIPLKYREEVVQILNFQSSPAKTLQIMKLGKGFVLANSSFSYWAAQLSTVPGSRIITPTPWFKDMVEPRDLINPKWKRINASWEV